MCLGSFGAKDKIETISVSFSFAFFSFNFSGEGVGWWIEGQFFREY